MLFSEASPSSNPVGCSVHESSLGCGRHLSPAPVGHYVEGFWDVPGVKRYLGVGLLLAKKRSVLVALSAVAAVGMIGATGDSQPCVSVSSRVW